MNNMKNIKLSKNPVPNFENLHKNYPSGYFNVPIVGAGTQIQNSRSNDRY